MKMSMVSSRGQMKNFQTGASPVLKGTIVLVDSPKCRYSRFAGGFAPREPQFPLSDNIHEMDVRTA